MAEAGNNHQNSNEGQQNTSTLPPRAQPFTDMQIHLTIRNDIELLGKFSVSPSPCADKGNGGTGGPWTWAWAETGWKRVGNARREAQTISSYSGLVWTPEGAGAAPLRVNLSESVAQHLVHAWKGECPRVLV